MGCSAAKYFHVSMMRQGHEAVFPKIALPKIDNQLMAGSNSWPAPGSSKLSQLHLLLQRDYPFYFDIRKLTRCI